MQPAPPPRCMHRRIEIDWALSSMTPKAVPAAPLGLRARQCHADADVEAAAAIADPIMTVAKKRRIIDLRDLSTSLSARTFDPSSPACRRMALRVDLPLVHNDERPAILRVCAGLRTGPGGVALSRRSRPKHARPCPQTSQIKQLKWEPSVPRENHQGLARRRKYYQREVFCSTPV